MEAGVGPEDFTVSQTTDQTTDFFAGSNPDFLQQAALQDLKE